MKFDILIENINIVDVINKKVFKGFITIYNGKFVLTEKGMPNDNIKINTEKIINGNNMYIVPGLIDTHMHIESSFVPPSTFAGLTVPFGLSTILWDFHEIANVAGIKGIEDIYEDTKNLPLNIYLSIPSCVPPTNLELETSNFYFGKKEISYLLSKEKAISLGEVMDYIGLINGNHKLIEIIQAAKEKNKIIDGHVPTLKGEDLSKYIYHGISSDHTLATPEKIEEELQKGIWVQLQEKSITEENIAYLKKRRSLERILFVTDDVPVDKITEGHLLFILNKAINMGIPPIEAIASTTIRAAQRLMKEDIGAIAPGKEANFLLTQDISKIKAEVVYFKGKIVAKKNKYIGNNKKTFPNYPSYITIDKIKKEDFKFKKDDGLYKVNIIDFNNQNSFTTLSREIVKLKGGYPIIENNISLVGVFSRNGKSKNLGFIRNLGPKKGAIATTYSHDAHQLTIFGKDIEDMVYAGNILIENNGGIIVVESKKIVSFIPLKIYGLLSEEEPNIVIEKFKKLKEALISIGVNHANPTLIITLLTLSVSPLYKISDKGIIDTERRKIVPLFVEE